MQPVTRNVKSFAPSRTRIGKKLQAIWRIRRESSPCWLAGGCAMAELSPAAQAVLNAAKHEPKAEYIGTLELRIAAALRAVAAQADQIGDRLCVPAHNILTIAHELENAND